MDFLYSYIVLAAIYVLLGLSTNLLVGIAGIFSVSQAAVFGVGAYLVAHFMMAADPLSFIPSLAIAATCCIALNILVTLPSASSCWRPPCSPTGRRARAAPTACPAFRRQTCLACRSRPPRSTCCCAPRPPRWVACASS
jgi:hypothetical protein